MSLNQDKIMLGLRVRVVRGTYLLGQTGTITKIYWDDDEFRDYVEEILIKWDRKFWDNGRKTDSWYNYEALEEITEPDLGPIMHPSKMQVGWKIQLWDMPRSKYHRKVSEVIKVVRNSYFVTEVHGSTMRWHMSLAPMFRGVPKPVSARKVKKLEREALLAKFFYGA